MRHPLSVKPRVVISEPKATVESERAINSEYEHMIIDTSRLQQSQSSQEKRRAQSLALMLRMNQSKGEHHSIFAGGVRNTARRDNLAVHFADQMIGTSIDQRLMILFCDSYWKSPRLVE